MADATTFMYHLINQILMDKNTFNIFVTPDTYGQKYL